MTSAVFGSFQEGLVNLAGGGEDYRPVALVHVWRKNKAVHIVYLSVFVTKVHNSPQRAQCFTEFFYFFKGYCGKSRLVQSCDMACFFIKRTKRQSGMCSFVLLSEKCDKEICFLS